MELILSFRAIASDRPFKVRLILLKLKQQRVKTRFVRHFPGRGQ